MLVRPEILDDGDLQAGRLSGMSQPWTPVDPLGEALHVLRMSGTFYSRCEFTAPWGLVLPPMPGSLMFHVVTAGRCWLEVAGAEPRPLQPGDLAPRAPRRGAPLASEPGVAGARLFDLPREDISERYEVIRQGGGGAPTSLVCGTVRFDHPAAHHLVDVLPTMIAVDAWSSPETEWIASTLRFMAAEAKELRPGGETVITRLADVLVIQAIRSWIEHDPAAQTGWLGALRDRQVGRALALIHRDPARAWTVASLAARGRDVALGLRRALRRARRRVPHALSRPLADARRADLAEARTTPPSASSRSASATDRRRPSAGPSSA